MKARVHKTQRAFTLVEMLTVIAITAVLLTLIIVPVIQSFNFTRAAEGFSDAQEKGRRLIERISREIGNASDIRDNSERRGELAFQVPGRNGVAIAPIILENTKLDIIKAAEGEPIFGPGGGLWNPNIGKEDPTQQSPIGQIVLPVAPGSTIIRYAVGLRDPFRPYNNPYDGILMARNGDRDNLFVLYRFEVRPYIWQGGRYVANTTLFETDPGTIIGGDPLTAKPILDDPYFLIPDRDSTGTILGGAALAAKQARVQAWLDASTNMTEVSRYDMIQAVFERRTRQPIYDGDVPRLLSLIQFKPASIGNEPATAMAAVRISEETDNRQELAPDVLQTKYHSWTSSLVRMWPSGWSGNNPYLLGRWETTPNGPRFIIFLYDPLSGQPELTGGLQQFDSTYYDLVVAANHPYPFSKSLIPANLSTIAQRGFFTPYAVNMKSGRITASFSIEEVGDPTQTIFRADRNRPTAETGPELTPSNDTNTGGTIADPIYAPSNSLYQINKLFNKIWIENPGLRPNIHRFIDLRVLPAPDGTPSPLHPDPLTGFAKARMVPGSEIVTGPDQRPGPNYGNPVRYTRTTREPSANQYRINYVNQPEPNYALLGLPNPPPVYTPSDIVSAVIQPRYKAGYVQLYSDPNVPLPNTLALGNITVSYRFQFTGVGDTFAVDYDTRELIDVLLTIRNYTQSNLPNPQTITLKATPNVRNVIR
ncbi:MAG: prepilin-type N-terminal cleavage/methylation domain-containing protein [Fimbriimonadaceae bacterium]|nr:prepilin-type N-terminal cleavage/methylation domain-containing protein [Fimbriimonadaceae bacterium]